MKFQQPAIPRSGSNSSVRLYALHEVYDWQTLPGDACHEEASPCDAIHPLESPTYGSSKDTYFSYFVWEPVLGMTESICGRVPDGAHSFEQFINRLFLAVVLRQ